MNKLITILFAMALTTAVWAQEESNTPGWANAEGWVDATEVDGSRESEEGFGLGTGISGGQSAIAEAITPEIQELARGLENDPKRIFDYVHDHIRHILYFGSKKGAELTLLERSGNDFDQSALLVALLSAAGYSNNVSYQYGWQQIPYDDLS